MYHLDEEQKKKLIKGVKVALSVPFIDSLEDFIWEGVFCYAKGLKIIDPLFNKRKKLLFDVVDAENQIWWSAKALQCPLGSDFELVIQRADVFKKARELWFPNGLNVDSDPADIGKALLLHWNGKIKKDAEEQGVSDLRVCILLKTVWHSRFAYIEEPVARYSPEELVWKWTNDTKTGLQWIRKKDNFCVYRWYPNQKQFFERFKFDSDTFIFGLSPKRLESDKVMDSLHDLL